MRVTDNEKKFRQASKVRIERERKAGTIKYLPIWLNEMEYRIRVTDKSSRTIQFPS